MAKYITYTPYQRKNGTPGWLYNFVDTESKVMQVEINREFKNLGRVLMGGIFSQLDPDNFVDYMRTLTFRNSLPVYYELSKAQKMIDKCNGKKGCLSCCSLKHQHTCPTLNKHYEYIERLNYVCSFIGLQAVSSNQVK